MGGTVHFEWKNQPVKRGRDLGLANNQAYVWAVCSNCPTRRWVRIEAFRKPKFSGLCLHCSSSKNAKANLKRDPNYHHSDETKQKIGLGQKRHLASGGKHSMQGRHHSKETKTKMRASQLGKVVTEETRAKLSKAHTGRKHTKAYCRKMSKIKKGIAPKNVAMLSSKEVIEKRRKTLSKTIAEKMNLGIPVGFSTVRGGRRADLDNIFFRSSWEANYARYLNAVDVKWEYEKHSFEFPIKRGTRFYTPDFYLPDEHTWIEIKGRMEGTSKTKLSRFKKYYPDEFRKLQVMILDPYAMKNKAQRKAIRFLSRILSMPFESYMFGYRQLDEKCRSIIPGWEKR